MDEQVRRQVESWAGIFGPLAVEYGMRPSLVAGLIAVESGGNWRAESPMNVVDGRPIGRAQGLMQVMPGHFGMVLGADGEATLAAGRGMRQPVLNLSKGIGLLASLHSTYGAREASAVAAYFGAVDAAGNPTAAADVTGTPGTRYVELVLGVAEEFRWLDGIDWARLHLPDEVASDVAAGYCAYGETWPDVAATLLGVCNDALEAGREVAQAARDAAELWGTR